MAQEVRSTVATLLRHEYIRLSDPSLNGAATATYAVHPFNTYLRRLIPLFVTLIAQKYGDVGYVAATALYEYSCLPIETLESRVLQLRPELQPQCAGKVQLMCNDGLLTPAAGGAVVTSKRELPSDSTQPPLDKRSRKSDAAPAPSPRLLGMQLYCLNFAPLLWQLRADFVLRYIDRRYPGDAVPQLWETMLEFDANRSTRAVEGRGVKGYQRLPEQSAAVSEARLIRQLMTSGGIPQSSAIAAISSMRYPATFVGVMRLSRVEHGNLIGAVTHRQPLLTRATSTSGDVLEDTVAISYDTVLAEMRAEHAEELVRARHGVLGVRLMKLLHERGPMEDRFLAEEALVAQTDVRTTLNNMLRDAYVTLMELPRVAYSVERSTRNSVFLWCLSSDGILRAIRAHTVKLCLTVCGRIAAERRAIEAVMPALYFGATSRGGPSACGNGNADGRREEGSVALSASQITALSNYDAAIDALNRCYTTLLERIALLEIL